jgi:hypothetical protein
MFKSIKAKSIKEYIASVPEDRKELIVFLHHFIQKAAPDLAPYLASNMLGYGSFPYKNYKKEIVTWPTIALANQKNYVSIYVCAISDGQYIAEKYRKKLGKVNVGKSCIRFRKLEDVHLPTLTKVISEAARHPGLD